MTTISKALAEATLDAVKAQHATYLNPHTIDGTVYPALYDPPVLVWDYTDSGAPAIVWEDGPDEWAYRIDGSPSDEDRSLYAEASAEFGVAVRPSHRPAAKIPAGVYVEPHMSFILALYPA